MKALFLALVIVATGCTTTVVPVKVQPTTASMDGNEANSGFIAFTKSGAGLITPHARDRYNALVEKYGNRFLPVLQKDSGIRPAGDVYEIDGEHLAKFSVMNRWRKEGK
jgi:hypothetical protein